ncbi:Acid phosphatase-like protein [Quillaja saponaria]|uniref:Acid phosphatase-like protein n=1 Tax=Quillaja saponaria TaxID=32244 RepID=A0AAD7PR45_QUISA|nr:Acid phosphatase-like protein [Quillaja saponaria]
MMSAYAHQMEREYSAQSVPGASELGSRYTMESGFYMTSFAATIFIAALVTVGVLVITLLIALTVMLQSCQSKSAGIIEIQRISDDYNFCKVYALHVELNGLEANDFPKVCRAFSIQYIEGGQYARDLDSTKAVVEDYFNSVRPINDDLDVVLIDIDDILSSNTQHSSLLQRFHQSRVIDTLDCIEEAKHLKQMLILSLYMRLQASGWNLILLSRKPIRQQNATMEYLFSAGFRGHASLMMREDDEDINTHEYFHRQRAIIQRDGFCIKAVISSHMDALTLPGSGVKNFKLPDPVSDKFEHQTKSYSDQKRKRKKRPIT